MEGVTLKSDITSDTERNPRGGGEGAYFSFHLDRICMDNFIPSEISVEYENSYGSNLWL